MKALPLNKFTVAALIWFAAAIYALLFKEGGNSAPPFPHFDKVGHFGLFFGQAWLCAKIFIQDNRNIPYKGILFAALLFAVGSELAQAFLTTTRQGSIADGIADMVGTVAALWFATKVKAAKSQTYLKNLKAV